jgi:hypothetical protein
MTEEDLVKLNKMNKAVDLIVEICNDLNLTPETVMGEHSMIRTLVERKLKKQESETI